MKCCSVGVRTRAPSRRPPEKPGNYSNRASIHNAVNQLDQQDKREYQSSWRVLIGTTGSTGTGSPSEPSGIISSLPQATHRRASRTPSASRSIIMRSGVWQYVHSAPATKRVRATGRLKTDSTSDARAGLQVARLSRSRMLLLPALSASRGHPLICLV
jgi:hypothetical protein